MTPTAETILRAPSHRVHEVPVVPVSPDRLADLAGPGRVDRLDAAAEHVRRALDGHVVWHVNTTAQGGGVAEMLWPLVAYARGAGIDCRWCVIGGDAGFFRVTKRIHNRLHGSFGDNGPLDASAREAYERVLAANAAELRGLVFPGDVVVLHDPQTAGLVAPLRRLGAHVVWRAHVGVDEPTQIVRDTWDFLRPYVEAADAWVFSRPEHRWEGLQARRTWIIPPSIDAFSAKNQDIDRGTADAILAAAGLGARNSAAPPAFTDRHGAVREVHRPAVMLGAAAIDPDRPIVCQVSRWDRLKDPIGLMEGFVAEVLPRHDAQLVLAGPAVSAVADDPEGARVLHDVRTAWQRLPAPARNRVTLACLPMDDGDENAAIVNALQRRSDVIVQKSLAEGFGLTVSEAMWKARPVVASRVGGIQDQIEHRRSGLLLDDPHDLVALGGLLDGLLVDRDEARRMGAAARARVAERFLAGRHLMQYARLVTHLVADGSAGERPTLAAAA